jgi:predicted PurR-regulated permease PerM
MPIFDHRPITFDRVVRAGVGIAILVGLYLLILKLSEVLIPFAIAALLAYMINPLVVLLQNKARIQHRLAAILASLFIILLALAGSFAILIPILVDEIQHMYELLNGLAQDQGIKEKFQQYLPEDLAAYLAEMAQREDIRKIFTTEKVLEGGYNFLRALVPNLLDIFSGVLSIILGIFGVVIVLLYLIFILLDYDKIMLGWKDLLHPAYKDMIVEGVDEFHKAMSSYFRAQFIISVLTGLMLATGFSIIGLPLGFLLGLFVGLLNMVPYLSLAGIAPALILALMKAIETDASFGYLAILVLVVYGVAQLIQDAFLTPKIMGDATGLNPAIILLSLSIWGKLLGILGLIIALPLTFLIKSYYKRLLLYLQELQTGEAANEAEENST